MHNADYAVARCPSVRPPVCLSLTRRYSVKTAKHIYKLVFEHRVATPFYFLKPNGMVVFRRGPSHSGVAECRGYEKDSIFQPISRKWYKTMYNGRPIKGRIWSIERRHFQRPRTTPNPNFKVTPSFDAECYRNRRKYRHTNRDLHTALNSKRVHRRANQNDHPP